MIRFEYWDRTRINLFLGLAQTYRATSGVVRADRLENPVSWRSDNGSALTGTVGDWEVRDGAARWIVASSVFWKTYIAVDGQYFLRSGTVRARMLPSDVEIATLEGLARAREGDWLLENPDGDVWPVKADVFKRRYVPE